MLNLLVARLCELALRMCLHGSSGAVLSIM
jgi:hypothetical protein